MAEKKDKDTAPQAEITPAATNTAAPGKQQQISVRFDQAEVSFANFTLVTGTPEEVIVDFGINTNAQQVNVDIRMGMTYPTARRLAGALNETIRRFEQAVQQARTRQTGAAS